MSRAVSLLTKKAFLVKLELLVVWKWLPRHLFHEIVWLLEVENFLPTCKYGYHLTAGMLLNCPKYWEDSWGTSNCVLLNSFPPYLLWWAGVLFTQFGKGMAWREQAEGVTSALSLLLQSKPIRLAANPTLVSQNPAWMECKWIYLNIHWSLTWDMEALPWFFWSLSLDWAWASPSLFPVFLRLYAVTCALVKQWKVSHRPFTHHRSNYWLLLCMIHYSRKDSFLNLRQLGVKQSVTFIVGFEPPSCFWWREVAKSLAFEGGCLLCFFRSHCCGTCLFLQ